MMVDIFGIFYICKEIKIFCNSIPAIRSLIPIDFGCSKKNGVDSDRKRKTNNEGSLLHADISSSEDEWSRNDHV